MADIQLVLDSLDDVEESHKPLYGEANADGKYPLNLKAYDDFVKQPVVTKNKELLGKLKAADPLKKFKDVTDDDWTAYNEWKAKQADGAKDDDPPLDDPPKPQPKPHAVDQTERARLKADHDREVKRVSDKFKADLAAKDKAIADLEVNHKSFVRRTLLQELAIKTDVMPDRLAPWTKAVADNFRLSDEGELLPLDDDGDPLEQKAEKFSAETLRERYPFFYVSKEQGGSGTPPQAGGGTGSAKGLKRSAMDATAKAKYIRQYGGAAYTKLPA